MATTSAGYLGGQTNDELQQHLRRTALPDLFDNYELVQLATEAQVPSNQGLVMIIPDYTNDTDHGVKSTPNIASTSGLDSAPILTKTPDLDNLRDIEHNTKTATLRYYADGYKFSKVFARSVSIQDSMERASRYLMVGAAQNQERLVQNHVLYSNAASATEGYDVTATTGTLHNKNNDLPGYVSSTEPMYAHPSGDDDAWDDLASTDVAVAEGFAQARKMLRKRRAPGYSSLGGKYAAYVGPSTVHSLLTQVKSGGASLTFENDSMNMTDSFKDNVIGTLFGCVVYESTYVREIDDDDSDYATYAAGTTTNAGQTFEYNLIFGPDAFFVCPHESVNPGVIVKGFNEGGAWNPTNSVSSVSVDYLFAAQASNQIGERAVIMPAPVL